MFEVKEGDKLMIQGQGRYWIYNKEKDLLMCSGREVNLLSPITLEIKEAGYFYRNFVTLFSIFLRKSYNYNLII